MSLGRDAKDRATPRRRFASPPQPLMPPIMMPLTKYFCTNG